MAAHHQSLNAVLFGYTREQITLLWEKLQKRELEEQKLAIKRAEFEARLTASEIVRTLAPAFGAKVVERKPVTLADRMRAKMKTTEEKDEELEAGLARLGKYSSVDLEEV